MLDTEIVKSPRGRLVVVKVTLLPPLPYRTWRRGWAGAAVVVVVVGAAVVGVVVGAAVVGVGVAVVVGVVVVLLTIVVAQDLVRLLLPPAVFKLAPSEHRLVGMVPENWLLLR